MQQAFRGKSFVVDGLQFEPVCFDFPCLVLQHQHGGRTTAIAQSGIWCDEENFPCAEGAKWQTTLEETSRGITGHPADGIRGGFRREAVFFDFQDWRLRCGPGSLVIRFSLPENEGNAAMPWEPAIRAAWAFFEHDLSEIPFAGMIICSRMLDPRMLPLRMRQADTNWSRLLGKFSSFPGSAALEASFQASSPEVNEEASAATFGQGNNSRPTGGILLREDPFLSETIELREGAVFEGCIPMPLQIVVDDLGWWFGRDGWLENQPCRTGIERNHCYEDYVAAVHLGKELGMRPMFATVLGEWDTKGRVSRLIDLPWLAPQFEELKKAQLPRENVAALLRENVENLEIGLHGILHEYWEGGKISRTEWHDTLGDPRPLDSWTQRLLLFWELLEEYGFGQFPRSFVPPANRHHFCRENQNLAATLRKYGIRTIFAEIEKFVRSREPGHRWFGFDGSTMTIDRSHDPFRWNAMNPEQIHIPPVPVCSMHWPNILHPDSEKNLEVVDRWVRALRLVDMGMDRVLSRNTESFCEQLAHHETTRLWIKGNEVTVNASHFFQLPWADARQSSAVLIRMRSDSPLTLVADEAEASLLCRNCSAEGLLYELAIPVCREEPRKSTRLRKTL